MELLVMTEAQQWCVGIALALMVLDIASGVMKAIKAGNLSSTVMREGLYHKATYILIMAMAYVVELGSAHVDLGFEIPMFIPFCLYVIGMEARSIYENAKEVNPDLGGSPIDNALPKSDD